MAIRVFIITERHHTARNSKARKGMANAEIGKGEIVTIHEEKLTNGPVEIGGGRGAV